MITMLLLDVADATADHDCPEIARELYRAVIAIYIGTGNAPRSDWQIFGHAAAEEVVYTA